MQKTFTLDELRKEAVEYLRENGFEATEPLEQFLNSLNPNKQYTIDDLRNVLELFR